MSPMDQILPATADNKVVNTLGTLGNSFAIVGTSAPQGARFGRYLSLIGAGLIINKKDVKLFSPDSASAADKTIPRGARFLSTVFLLSLRYDNLILSLEPQLPFSPTSKRLQRAVILNGLAVALKKFSHIALICDSPIQIPGGIGGRTAKSFWSSFDYIVVQNQDDFDQVSQLSYVDGNKILLVADLEEEKSEYADLSQAIYDDDTLGILPIDQVSSILQLRARRARQLTHVADEISSLDQAGKINTAGRQNKVMGNLGDAISFSRYLTKRIWKLKAKFIFRNN